MSPKIHLVFSAALFYDRLCVYCGIITLEAYQTKDCGEGFMWNYLLPILIVVGANAFL